MGDKDEEDSICDVCCGWVIVMGATAFGQTNLMVSETATTQSQQ
jgi:hypothetical protein